MDQGVKKNPYLHIGTLNDSISDLKNNANKLRIALQKMNIEYDKAEVKKEDICSFCRKNVHLFI
jgi:PP-loop superfamily ATP-utilizing enzyme